MSETVYVFWCDACQSVMEITTVVDEYLDGKPISGHFACSRCGKRYGVWLDGGELDLESVRESDLNANNDFEVFA